MKTIFQLTTGNFTLPFTLPFTVSLMNCIRKSLFNEKFIHCCITEKYNKNVLESLHSLKMNLALMYNISSEKIHSRNILHKAQTKIQD